MNKIVNSFLYINRREAASLDPFIRRQHKSDFYLFSAALCNNALQFFFLFFIIEIPLRKEVRKYDIQLCVICILRIKFRFGQPKALPGTSP